MQAAEAMHLGLNAAVQVAESVANGAHHAPELDESCEPHEQSAEQGWRAIAEMLAAQLKEKDRTIESLTTQVVQLSGQIAKGVQPRFIDIGLGAFNVALIEGVGIWAEKEEGNELSPERPRLRVRGETFDIEHSAMLFLRRELGLRDDPGNLHDKYQAIADENSCLNKAQYGEPIFILRAQDALAADLVREWADRAELNGCAQLKVEDARLTAELMDQFPGRKFPD